MRCKTSHGWQRLAETVQKEKGKRRLQHVCQLHKGGLVIRVFELDHTCTARREVTCNDAPLVIVTVGYRVTGNHISRYLAQKCHSFIGVVHRVLVLQVVGYGVRGYRIASQLGVAGVGVFIIVYVGMCGVERSTRFKFFFLCKKPVGIVFIRYKTNCPR